jgi:hypothetical protein
MVNVSVGDAEFFERAAEYQKYYKSSSPWSKLLLSLPFTTLSEYLEGLENISRFIGSKQIPSITYLAAAVSDFYIPLD